MKVRKGSGDDTPRSEQRSAREEEKRELSQEQPPEDAKVEAPVEVVDDPLWPCGLVRTRLELVRNADEKAAEKCRFAPLSVNIIKRRATTTALNPAELACYVRARRPRLEHFDVEV